MATISTGFKLPTAVIQNGQGVVGWTDPDNILLVDDRFAVSGGPTNILEVGMFNHNVPQGATINNITVRIKGYRGSFNTTLDIYAVDDTSGVAFAYPYAPAFQSFSGSNTLYTLNPTLFATTWTVDQINNIKFKLIADGELHMDSIEVDVQYTEEDPAPAPSGDTGEEVCDEFVQAQPFKLAQSVTSGELFIYLESFAYPNGDPIQFADFHGEDALLVIDQGIPGKEENVRITAVEQNYNGTGTCRISFGVIENRGLKFKYPYDHDIDLCQDHSSTAEVVISNSAPFYSRFLKKCNIDALVSAPIYISDENVQLPDPAHELDFRGTGVTVVNDTNTFKKIITIQGTGNSTPVAVETSSSTTGDAQASTLTWQHVSSGINRLLVVQVVTEAAETITGITFNGDALTQESTVTNGTLRVEQWSLVAPDVGTYDIVITMSGDAYITAGAETFVSVNQSTPIGATQTATGSSNTASTTLVTTVDNSLVVDATGTGTLPIVYTVGSGQVANWSITSNPNLRQGASSVEASGTSPDNVVMSWAFTQSTPWAISTIEIIGITGVVPGGVQSVTGLDTDNTDPANPVVQIAVDGVTIIGDGTPGNPLVAVGGSSSLEIEEDGVSVETGVTKINFTNGPTVTNPAPGEVDVDFSGLFGGGGGGSSAIYTAAEDLTIGDPVGTSVGDADSVALANWYDKTFSIAGASPTNFSRAVYIGNNTFAVVYGTGGTGTLSISIVEIDRNTMTATEVAQGGLGVGNQDNSSICSLGTVGKFLVAYTLDGTNNGEVVVGEWDGVSLSFGTDVVIDGSGDVDDVKCCSFGTDRAAVAFQRQVPNTTYVSVITVSGTVPTDAANDTIGGSNFSDGDIDMCQIDTEKFVIVSSGSVAKAYEYTAPATLTGGANLAITGNPGLYVRSAGTDGKFLILNTTAGYELEYCSVSGVTITIEDTMTVSSPSGYGLECIDTTTFLIYVSDGTVNEAGIYQINISGGNTIDTPILIGSRVFLATSGNRADIVNFSTEGYWVLLGIQATPHYFIEGMSGNFIGFAQSTVSRGDSVQVLTGGIDTNQTGISPGTIYEVTDGALVATLDITVPFKVLGRSSTDVQMPGGGGDSEKRVGVGEIGDTTWFNIQLPFSMVNSTDAGGNVWDIQASGLVVNPSYVNLSDAEYFSISSDQVALLPDFTGGLANGYHFDSNLQAIFSCMVYTTIDVGANKGGIGFNTIGTNAIITAQGGNALSVGFVRDTAGQWYARCATGAAFTETAIAITDGIHVFRCEYDPGNATPQARFYVDGTLLATVTTNVPSAINTVVGWAAGQNTGTEIALDTVGCPSFAVEI